MNNISRPINHREMDMNKNSDMVCVWCGSDTKNEKSVEHIFPESIGGKITLPRGDVCLKCNMKLSHLDRRLKYGTLHMIRSYQNNPNLIGKKTSSRQRKARRKNEKKKMSTLGTKPSITVVRDGDDTKINIFDLKIDHNEFCRALHKCIINCLCHIQGTKITRMNHSDLLEFVIDNKNFENWSYAFAPLKFNYGASCTPTYIACESREFTKKEYREMVAEVVDSKGKILYQYPYKIIDSIKTDVLITYITFIHTSGIYLCSTIPNIMNEDIIKKHGDRLLNTDNFITSSFTKHEDLLQYFGYSGNSTRGAVNMEVPKYYGKLKLDWIKHDRVGFNI